MKQFSRIVEGTESTKQINVREEALNYISVEDLEKYLEIANKFISKEAKEVCQWLIANNGTYIKDFGKKGNALENFFNNTTLADRQKDPELQKLWSNLKALNNPQNNRLLEVPVFQTEGEFKGILSKKVSPDEVFIDLTTHAGRNKVAKDYDQLCKKIAHQWVGKSGLDYDELYGVALEWLTYAMNTYGKKSNKQLKREADGGEVANIADYKKMTFFSYAAQCIRVGILEAIKHESHLVRIPASQQARMRKEQGFVAKDNTVSGDVKMGDDENSKTIFDIIGADENPYKEINKVDLDELWDKFWTALSEKFSEKEIEIYKNHFGFGDSKKLTGIEMAKKYGYKSAGTISVIVTKMNKEIMKDKKLSNMLSTLYTAMNECKSEDDEYERDFEDVAYINNYSRNNNDMDDND